MLTHPFVSAASYLQLKTAKSAFRSIEKSESVWHRWVISIDRRTWRKVCGEGEGAKNVVIGDFQIPLIEYLPRS